MIRAVLVGATGRMGQAIIRVAVDADDITITAAVDSAESTLLGRDAGELAGVPPLDVAVSCDIAAALELADVVIDFSSPKATEEHVAACRKAGKPLLLGTTGHSPALAHVFERAAREIALLVSPNTSLGATVLLELARAAAGALPREFDAEIIEAHHRMKKDAPSGTALALGAAVAQGRGGQLTDIAVMDRQRGAMRRSGDIGFAVVRGGDLVGEHTVIFAGDGESLTLTHRAVDRSIFAKGALRAAAWLTVQPPGRYSMGDILLAKTGC
jgi:4-hydroxy-tetrahydrodipicolinate reductase